MNIFSRKKTPVASIAEVTTGIDNDAGAAFLEIYNSIEGKVPFSQSWNNGTGYFNGAVREVKLASGERAASRCPETDRRLILLGTVLGTVVFFERYSGGADGVVVANAPHGVRCLHLPSLRDSSIGAEDLKKNLGARWNLAKELESMRDIFAAGPDREG
jgi:hypothetical protein